MANRLQRLAELAVHGANVQPGQILLVTAEIGNEDVARAVAEAGYRRGASFVDVDYFDPYVKRARIEHAPAETLGFVPSWYGQRIREHAAQGGARVTLASLTAPDVLAGLDPERAGRDSLPRLKELTQTVRDRTTNWCIVPAPHRAWARVVHPEVPEDEAYERLWRELEHVLRLDEPDAVAAWDERMASLSDAADRLTARAFDAFELRGPGTELTVGMLRGHRWLAADFRRVDGLRHLPNLPSEEVFTTPDPTRTNGHVTATKPLVLREGATIRGLRVRFEDGVAVAVDADENAGVLRKLLEVDDGALRLGELALVDGHGRIGPLGTVFYNTLLDENAASHVALGAGFPFAVGADVVERVNGSAQHVDFMVGSPEVDVDGLTADGTRVPVLRGGDWQI
ncbi:MAG TPA: aminopeptidase [Gaiellaceae bacterium]